MSLAAPPGPPLNNLANQLTASRLVLGVVLFVLIAVQQWVWCVVVFALAALTDWLDGVAARRLNVVSSFGRMFDPLVDKVVVSGAFILLLPEADTGLQAWMVVLVVAREFLITGLRGHLEQQGVSFGADLFGKLKMVLQSAALFAIFLALGQAEAGHVPGWVAVTRDALVWGMTGATALSGLNYCWQAAKWLR